MQDCILRRPAVERLVGLGRSTIYAMIAEGTFPKPVLRGDTTAPRLCLERVCPPRKDTPVQVELRPIESAGDAAQAAGAIVSVVAQGELTPLEGASVMSLVENYRRTLETTEIERRMAELVRVLPRTSRAPGWTG